MLKVMRHPRDECLFAARYSFQGFQVGQRLDALRLVDGPAEEVPL